MRALISLTLVLVSPAATVSAAPAPLPKPVMPREWQEILRAAEDNRSAAARLIRDLLPSDSQTQQEVARLNRAAAEQFSRVVELLMTRRRGPATKDLVDLVAMKAGKAWVLVGEHTRAVAFYEGVALRSGDPQRRCEARAGAINCRVALRQLNEVRRLLPLIRKDLPRLSRDRRVWQQWLDAAEKVVGQ